MAESGQRDLIARVTDRGEEMIAKVADVPGAAKALQAVVGMRERLDEVQRRVRGLDAVEQRLDALERRVEELAKAAEAKPAPRRRAATKGGAGASGGSTGRKRSSGTSGAGKSSEGAS